MPITKDTVNSSPSIIENDFFEEIDICQLKGNALAYAFAIAVGIPVFLSSNKKLDLSLTSVNSNSSYTNHKGTLLTIHIDNVLLYRTSRQDLMPKVFAATYKTLGWFIDEYSIDLVRSTRTEVTGVISREGRHIQCISSSYVEAAMRTIALYELKQDSIYVPKFLLKE